MDTTRIVWIYTTLVIIGFFITAIAAGLYGLLAPWYKSNTGRAFFTLLAALTLILLNSTLGIWFGRSDIRLWAGLILFGVYCVAMLFIGWYIFNAQVRRYYTRRKDREWQL